MNDLDLIFKECNTAEAVAAISSMISEKTNGGELFNELNEQEKMFFLVYCFTDSLFAGGVHLYITEDSVLFQYTPLLPKAFTTVGLTDLEPDVSEMVNSLPAQLLSHDVRERIDYTNENQFELENGWENLESKIFQNDKRIDTTLLSFVKKNYTSFEDNYFNADY